MNKKLFFLLFSIVFAFFNAQEIEKNQLIIKIKKGKFNKQKVNLSNRTLGINSIDQKNKELGVVKISPIGKLDYSSTFLIEFSNQDILKASKIYKNDANVEYAEPNYIAHASGVKGVSNVSTFPNDTYFLSRQWGLYNNGLFTVSGMTTTADADVDMELAWDIETGDPNMIIAVSDSGLNMTHEDIANRIWNKSIEIIDGIDNDGNGLIDDFRGWDFVNNDNDPTDDHGHGTNCTGIIGCSANNAKGYTGVNWNSKIMPLKVLNSSNSASYSNMAKSLYYAADNGAKVISMSIGGPSQSSLISHAISYLKSKNVLFVVCMMNNNNETPYYPAAFSLLYDNVIAVGSTDANDKRTQPFFWSTTSGSSYGNHINVVAPGNYIYGLGIDSNTSYNYYWGGTSQATPLVAGVASLIFAKNPSLTPAQVRNILEKTAEDLKGLPSEDVAGFDKYHGWGRINAAAALSSSLLLSTAELTSNSVVKVINPVKNNIIEIFSEQNLTGYTNVSLLGFDGKLIFNKKININKGKSTISLQGLMEGNYILTIDHKDFKKVFKLSVK